MKKACSCCGIYTDNPHVSIFISKDGRKRNIKVSKSYKCHYCQPEPLLVEVITNSGLLGFETCHVNPLNLRLKEDK